MVTRFATLLLVVAFTAACQLKALNQEPAEITLTPWPSAEGSAQAAAEPLISNEDDDLGLLVAGAPPTDIVAITPTGGRLAPTRPAPTGRCTVAPNGRYDVNIREGAGTQFAINGVLRYGDFADAYARTNSGWIEVDIPGTGSGWISSAVVTLNGPCNLQIVGENVGNTSSITAAPPINATPTAHFLSPWPNGYTLLTTTQVGSIPANTNVTIGTAHFDGAAWVYQIVTRDGKTADARDSQLMWAPGITPGAPTPAPAFDPGWGFSFVTTAQVGAIPANTRVRISMMNWDGYEWIYQISADNVTTVEARESQIGFYPGTNPVGATPTSQFGVTFASGYVYVTTQAVGLIPAGTRVAIGSMYFDGYGWMYQVSTREGLGAELRDSQLDFAPDFNPAAPTPTMAFSSVLGMGVSWVVTTEQIGSIPANSRVRVSTAWYDGYDWIYSITTDERTFAEARQSQLAGAPDATPGAPTPGSTPQSSPVECRAMANTAFGVVNIRSGPGAHFATLNAFGTNEAVSVLGRTDNGWYLVRMHAFGNPFEGFAPAGEIALSGDCDNLTAISSANIQSTPAVQELPPDASPSDVVIPEGLCTVIATTGSVNIYSENRVDSAVVGVLQPGPWLQANARDDKGWYRVTLLSGGLGWVNGDQLQVNGRGGACDQLSVL